CSAAAARVRKGSARDYPFGPEVSEDPGQDTALTPGLRRHGSTWVGLPQALYARLPRCCPALGRGEHGRSDRSDVRLPTMRGLRGGVFRMRPRPGVLRG